MSKFQQDATLLLAAVGGKENISAVTHCVTRMRFVLVDPKQADIARIEVIGYVKGTFTQSGQFQVIIGNEVSEFYQEFTALAGIEGVSKDAVKAAATAQQNGLQRVMSALGEIFAPIIPALIYGGLILGFRNIIGEIAMFDGKTLAQTSQFWQGMYQFLWLIGEAVFHMLPIGIVWSITRKMGTTPILGIVLGATLVSPQLLNAFAVASTEADKIPHWDFGFMQVNMIGYQGQVISAILAGFVLVYLERFFRRISPRRHFNDCRAVLFAGARGDYCAYASRADWLEDWYGDCRCSLWRADVFVVGIIRRRFWFALCAGGDDRFASYDQRH